MIDAIVDMNQLKFMKNLMKHLNKTQSFLLKKESLLTEEELLIIKNTCQYEELTEDKNIILYMGSADLYRFEQTACYDVDDFWYKDTPQVKKKEVRKCKVIPVISDIEIGFRRNSRTERTVTGKRRSSGQSDVCDHRLDHTKLHIVQTCDIVETTKEHPKYHFDKQTGMFLHIYLPDDRLK